MGVTPSGRRPTGGQPTVAPYVVPTASPAAEPLSFLTQTFRYCFAVARTGGSLQYLFGRTRSETHA